MEKKLRLSDMPDNKRENDYNQFDNYKNSTKFKDHLDYSSSFTIFLFSTRFYLLLRLLRSRRIFLLWFFYIVFISFSPFRSLSLFSRVFLCLSGLMIYLFPFPRCGVKRGREYASERASESVWAVRVACDKTFFSVCFSPIHSHLKLSAYQ
jgi:hypothetical protein